LKPSDGEIGCWKIVWARPDAKSLRDSAPAFV